MRDPTDKGGDDTPLIKPLKHAIGKDEGGGNRNPTPLFGMLRALGDLKRKEDEPGARDRRHQGMFRLGQKVDGAPPMPRALPLPPACHYCYHYSVIIGILIVIIVVTVVIISY